MQVTLTIPDDLAAHLIAPGQDPAQAAIEALALEGYRSQRLSENEVRLMLGYETRTEVHSLLAAHDVCLHYTLSDLEHDIQASEELHAARSLPGSSLQK